MSIKLKTLPAALAMTGLVALQVYGANEAAGKAAYEKSCKSCHGPDGSGNPGVAKMFKVELRHLGSKEVQAKTDLEYDKFKALTSAAARPVDADFEQAAKRLQKMPRPKKLKKPKS